MQFKLDYVRSSNKIECFVNGSHPALIETKTNSRKDVPKYNNGLRMFENK